MTSELLYQQCSESDEQIRARCVFISKLQIHIEKCEKEENYVEADKCRRSLQEHCIQDRRARIVRLKERHRLECEQLEEIMREECREREESWKGKLLQFDTKYQEELRRMKFSQQQKKQQDQTNKIQKLDAQFPRPSVKLTELRSTQQQLVRMKNYKQAEVYKIKADALEQLEIQQKDASNQESLIRQLQNYEKSLEKEYKTLEQKLNTQKRQLRDMQSQDYERICKKQENIRKQLQQSQTQELQRLRKAPDALPFILDEDGNDLLSTPNGLQEVNQILREQKPQLEVKSLVRAYIDGVLTVRAGEVYYSTNDQFLLKQMNQNQQEQNQNQEINEKQEINEQELNKQQQQFFEKEKYEQNYQNNDNQNQNQDQQNNYDNQQQNNEENQQNNENQDIDAPEVEQVEALPPNHKDDGYNIMYDQLNNSQPQVEVKV